MKIVAVGCLFPQWISGTGTIVAAQLEAFQDTTEKKGSGASKGFSIPNPSPPSYRLASHRLANTERRPTNAPPRQPIETEQRLAGAPRLNAKLLLSPVVLMVTLPLLLMMPLLLLPSTPHIAAISAARASAAAFLRSSLRSFFCFALSLRASAYGKRKRGQGGSGLDRGGCET